MIYDEHRKNANRSKLRKNRPADLLFHARFSASRALLKSPIFGEADRVAQPSWLWHRRVPCRPITSVFQHYQVYLLLLLYIFRKPAGSKSRDSVSQKNSRAQLAADGRHARACNLWRDRHL